MHNMRIYAHHVIQKIERILMASLRSNQFETNTTIKVVHYLPLGGKNVCFLFETCPLCRQHWFSNTANDHLGDFVFEKLKRRRGKNVHTFFIPLVLVFNERPLSQRMESCQEQTEYKKTIATKIRKL